MKKIINGKKYDTATAECIDSVGEGYVGDFSHWREQLCRKRNGEFFLYGWGGPSSRYNRAVGNGWIGGEEIIPMTDDEAREWIERNSDAEVYEQLFGECAE
jgi:hypothetical protein